MQLSFDIISDLNLSEEDKFIWEDKVTSLFCLVAGNISTNLSVVKKTLSYLSTLYQGVFFIDGSSENKNLSERNAIVEELTKMCRSLNNTVYLHNNVVIFSGTAIIGINGWYGNHEEHTLSDNFTIEHHRRDDLIYLFNTIKRLQIHMDVENIIVVSNSVPDKKLYFHEIDGFIDDVSPSIALKPDTEKKVKYWVFGTYDKMVDIIINDIKFISNPKKSKDNYYAKRLTI